MDEAKNHRVFWVENTTREEVIQALDKNHASFAIIQNNSDHVFLLTDEPEDGYRFADALLKKGISNWFIMEHNDNGISRYESDDLKFNY